MKKVNKFTDALVRNLKSEGGRYDVTEGNGFYIRVTANGKKAWVYRFKFNGKAVRMTLGYYPALSVADARKLMADASVLKDKGINPVQQAKDIENEKQRKNEVELRTVEWLATEFYTDYIVKNTKSPINVKQIIYTNIIPTIGECKVDKISTRQIVLILKEIAHRGANSHANKTLGTIKQMFNYAISVGITERNPAQGIKAKVIGGETPPRDRFLTMTEIKTIWLWFDNKENHKIHPASVIALKILLLTGIRSGSLRLAQWNEFNFDNNLWTIPVDHLKLRIGQPRQPQQIHLTPLVKELFIQLKELSGCKYVLPSKDESKPILKDSLARTVIRTKGRIKDIEPWTPHDLRRTFSTQLNNLGIDTGIVEKCLGHKLPAIMATYNKAEYLEERKQALELWSSKIKMLVTNSNVVMLRKAS